MYHFFIYLHCKYLRPNYDQIAAYRRTGTMIGCKFKLQWTTRKFPVKFIVDIGMNKKYTLVSKKSIEYNTKQLELQSKIVMFQNVNKHWRAHLERPLEKTIQSNWGPSRIHRGSIGGLSGVLWASNRGPLGVRRACSPTDLSKWPLQIISPSGLSNVYLHFGTLRSYTVILTA